MAGAVLAAPKHGAPKNVTECGTILTEPGNYKLVNDLLDCPGNGVEIHGSDIILNLHGHAISCDNDLEVAGVGVWSPTDSIIRNVTIKNGHISNCRDGIVLIQTEDSKVMNITSTGNTKWRPVPDVAVYGTGITVWLSRNNVIMHNHTYGNEGDGIGSWESSGNLFKHNTSTGNGDGWSGAGINLSNENNSRIMCNRLHGNADGMTVWWGEGENGSSGNLIRGNLVTENQATGISFIGFYWQDPDSLEEYYYAMPRGNTVRSNIVEQQPWVDLLEAHWDFGYGLLPNPSGECKNAWENNQFGTEIGVPGCIGTSVVLEENDVCALHDDDDD
jgi:parallel beta-helix repeat protein